MQARAEMAPKNSARRSDRRRFIPLVMVAFAVLFNLVVLQPQLRSVASPNDNALHLQMVKWAEHQVDMGRAPLDGWYPSLGLGGPHFRQYHSTPHQLAGYAAQFLGAERVLHILLYLLLAFWPLSVLWGARLLGWGWWASSAAAVVSPLIVSTPGYGFEHASYAWRGLGLWSQLWAMWTLPIALGLSWRAISRGRGYATAAAVLAITIAFHMFVGYLALAALGAWALLKRGQTMRRAIRSALVAIGALAGASWVLIPLMTDAKWVNSSIYLRDTFWTDSFGARKVMGWLITGQLFDSGRFPIVSILVAIGFGVCIWKFRTMEPARSAIAFFVLSLALFFGRPTLGPILKILPGAEDLQLHRFIFGVHMAGIVLAGVGIAWIGRSLAWMFQRVSRRALPAGVVALLVVGALMPGWKDIASYHREGAVWINSQRSADLTDGADVRALIETVKQRGDGRVFAGMRSGWGRNYKVGAVPVYSLLMEAGADAVGYALRVSSLSTDFETLFDETNVAHYDLFNVRYLLLPDDRPPPVKAELLSRRGRHGLWRVETSGYVQLVQTRGVVSADRSNIVGRLRGILTSPQLREHVHPVVAFAGRETPGPTLSPSDASPGSTGTVEHVAASDGTYIVNVESTQRAVAMLKTSFDPGWHVFVDGHESPAQMIAPSFVGVAVGAGAHVVVFRYQPYNSYPFLFLFGLGTLLTIGSMPRIGRRRRHRNPAVLAPLPASERDTGAVGLTVVVPAYNEGERIAETLFKIVEAIPEDAEVIVVDDGSSDRTAEIAAGFGGSVSVLRLEENSGKGAALRRGVAASRGRTVVFTDADLATDLEAMQRIIAGLRDADVAIGSRGLIESVVVGDSVVRARLGRGFARLQRLILRIGIADTQCGFKAFRGQVARQLFAAGTVDRFAFDAELLFLADRLGYRVFEVPVSWRAASESKVRVVRDSINMLWDLFAIRLRWRGVHVATANVNGRRAAAEPLAESAL